MKKLKEFRKKQGLSQDSMARKLGITLSMYEKVESGRAGASAAFMRRLKENFPEISIDSIFFGTDIKDLDVQEKVIDQKSESYIPILRGLISYHKRMMFGCESCCLYNLSEGVVDACKEKCPKKDTGDIYLEALEESLRLLEKEIGAVIGN